MGELGTYLSNNLADFWSYTGFANATPGALIMLLVGMCLIYLAIKKDFQPMLLIPIGFGILVGNILFMIGADSGSYDDSVFNVLYQGLESGWYLPLMLLGIGAMTDFSALISNPKLMLIGAAAQLGIFGAYILAMILGVDPAQAAGISIIGSANGPIALFLASKLSPELVGIVALSVYAYIALIPVIQPPLMRLLTNSNDRVIKMKPARQVSHTEKLVFPVVGLVLTCLLVPSALPLLGMLFFGNLLKESGVTRRLAEAVSGTLLDIVTVLLGLTAGVTLTASNFFTVNTVFAIVIGILAIIIATASGILFIKLTNLFLKEGNKINPLIGNAGIASPLAANISEEIGLEYDSTNYLSVHAMGPNVAGIIGAALAAGILMSFIM
ncbi:oxaloacetate decarboxylase, beta subunit [Bacteroides luti]|uniref:Oxaloacetate decarboxylase, beta subunit n=1 Tax=Bacteroides luti TaxID=1297750 RepID=A0A1M5CJP4_9BACE|nr:sodium ion-translocating decarboxylase subunit beta [Bacteroides luti]SHF54827.1 oxaloacetate decarboxylase, beta subunit [Bacteroides luti]